MILLDEIFRTDEEGQWDYLYYLAVANAKLKMATWQYLVLLLCLYNLL